MTPAQQRRIKARIKSIFRKHAAGRSRTTVPIPSAAGKTFELWALANIVRALTQHESATVTLKGGSRLRFRQSHGPVRRDTAYFEVLRAGTTVAEIFTDVEFLTQSYRFRTLNPFHSPPPEKADYHELDVAVLTPTVSDGTRPNHTEICLGAECKDTPMNKGFVRNMLGLRRELSMFSSTRRQPNHWLTSYPRRTYSNSPPSALILFCSDPRVRQYRSMSHMFDVDMRYLRV